jgi:hypothetical protein
MKLWLNKTYCLDSSKIFSKTLLNYYINIFWNEVVEEIASDKHVLILLRLEFENNTLVIIGQLQKLKKEDKKYFIDYLFNIIELKSDSYVIIPINSITFSYGF